MLVLKFRRIAWVTCWILFLQGCSKELIQVNSFSIETPKGWYLVEEQGYDSYVGCITNGKRTIFFDHGGLMADINKINENEHTIYLERLTINGDSAVIHKENSREGTVLSVYIQGKSTTRLYVRNPHNDNFYIKIFKTHVFK